MKLIVIAPMSLILMEIKTEEYRKKLEAVQKTVDKMKKGVSVQEQIQYLTDIINAIVILRTHLKRFVGVRLI